ncbi:hypothetical protein COW36_17085 [bacterium (Candidatus Blackallbacteria) CG17_big_fil_post_rev_8_21_14_2_50_48_46]|uniref:Glycine zipper domain-containing protein n=1 Tax=bacterium (Candidatus Blackallbacteria) CG17_big_fil_post_rev_8_21_14_2_50_48_46 TaxID=2014261 RepID=A0A2M7G1F3_9BACT|nr:MAG: hypothetical protein COW64_09395 [bacterium (Candidatus Blackallbacteria) CG18_big_fil_WC_8_21_14_2_50_49_26]PIW15516.1 MAG: hypothetical protein COW36_17085 [bacterium (Candidatus Blackallbacteria) CG17_big_fil_post_rev_8_21_14_2_50_48_46]PIW48583.1 MAG: hypothetical protein COW20_08755 [bacterium (Candidatus Blackallbacteria) CG13_big_fil_rev_8_21_14_2_50_49_14]
MIISTTPQPSTSVSALPSAPVAKASQAPKPHNLAAETALLSGDQIKIQKGILPTLKGAGAGFVVGGVAAGLSAQAAAEILEFVTGNVDDNKSLAFLMGGGLGAIAGATIGAVVANQTLDQKKAALYGSVVGGGVGLLLGAMGGGLRSAVTWGALGAGAGVGGAWAGAAVAQRQ